jgi:hypothetical protein
MRLLYAIMAPVKNTFYADAFLAYSFQPERSAVKNEGGNKLRMAKPKKNKNKAKLNLTVRDEERNKLEQMASLENRSVSNLVEIMADERWERLPEGAPAGKQELAETILEAHKALIKAADENIRLCKPVVDSLEQELHRETTSK